MIAAGLPEVSHGDIEGRQNLLKMMQEIPLTEDEQAAVEKNDIGAVDRLLEKQSGVPAPEKHKK